MSHTARLFTELEEEGPGPEDMDQEVGKVGAEQPGLESVVIPDNLASPDSGVFPDSTALAETALPEILALNLEIDDPDTVRELWQRPAGKTRHQFAKTALRIGVLALRQAEGQLDTAELRRESDRLLEALRSRLGEHTQLINQQVTGTLREYFDPQSGRFEERIRRLVTKDGELEMVLRGQIGESDSALAKTLSAFVGEQSPLMKTLSPDQSQGLLAALKSLVETQLLQQREQVLSQFSLDNETGALARLVKELTGRQGELSERLHEKIDEVVREFSLDEEDSALSRLVRNVDRAQRTITSEFSLDQEHSALARLKREMTSLLKEQSETNNQFQEEVKVALNSLLVKREEMQRSTRHGLHFEDAVYEFIQQESNHLGDIATHTGNTTGHIKGCKVGDCVVELGPENAAAGCLVVVEAKEKDRYHLADARREIEVARKNRKSQVGLFVFSKDKVPEGIDPLARYGDDVVVVWNPSDPQSDIYLRTGLTLARALCVKTQQTNERISVDFSAIDQAILEIEKRAGMLGDVEKSAEAIQNHCEKIMKRIRGSRKSLQRQSTVLQEQTSELKQMLGEAPRSE